MRISTGKRNLQSATCRLLCALRKPSSIFYFTIINAFGAINSSPSNCRGIYLQHCCASILASVLASAFVLAVEIARLAHFPLPLTTYLVVYGIMMIAGVYSLVLSMNQSKGDSVGHLPTLPPTLAHNYNYLLLPLDELGGEGGGNWWKVRKHGQVEWNRPCTVICEGSGKDCVLTTSQIGICVSVCVWVWVCGSWTGMCVCVCGSWTGNHF